VATPIDTRCEATREILAVDVRWTGDTAVIQPWGELDVASADRLRKALDEVCAPRCLVLDMRGLRFIDSTGMHLLTELNERATRERFELQLVAPHPPVDRAIRMCRLDQHLPFVADPAGAELAA
jgi:anti-anti-sigma factor